MVSYFDADGKYLGRFDLGAAQVFEEDRSFDGSANSCSRITGGQFDFHELARTAGGLWMRQDWSSWADAPKSLWRLTDEEDARAWLELMEYSPAEINQALGVKTRRPSGMTPAQFAALRHLIGLSQAELAERLGRARDVVRAWEGGVHAINEGVAAELYALVDEHTAYVDELRAAGRVLMSKRARGGGWDLAAAARVLAEDPTIGVEYITQESSS